jgi:ABC-2 type transport system ATP-binding protein
MAMIEVENLSKTFDGLKAVDGISFAVEPGEVFAFLGPNGAGKTTTIKMLTTLLAPTSGRVLIDGLDPARDPLGVRRTFGIVFQDASLDDELTAWENLDFHGALYGVPRAERRERIEALLKLVDLWGRRDELVKRFSGGMKRRLEIARGLSHGPKLLFLDEPTLGLDPQTRNHLWGFVRQLNRERGVTVFFTTHYMEEAEREATRIAVMDRARIIAQGSPSELKQRTGQPSLEQAFLSLTGHGIREEEGGAMDHMRMAKRLWGRR